MLSLLLSLAAHAALPAGVPAAVATGDCIDVVEKTSGIDTDDARLLRGRCQVRLDRPADAAATLAPVSEGVLGEYARLERAAALHALGEDEATLEALDGLRLPGRAGLRVRLLRGRTLIAAGRSLDARPDLRALLSTDVADEARYLLAMGALDRGEADPAIATFRRLWADSTRGNWSEEAAVQLLALGQPVPDVASADGRALVQQRIQALDKAHRYGESLVLRKELAVSAPPSTRAEHIAMARACFKGRDYGESVTHFARVHGTPEAATGTARDLFDHALATSRTGDYDTAAVLYGRLASQHPGTAQADSARYKLGYLHVDRQEWPEARRALKAYLDHGGSKKHVDEAWWWTGWSHFVEGDTGAAVTAWKRLVAVRPDSSLVPAARYWTARASGLSGNAEAERSGLQVVLQRHPTSGYAWYAAERLGAVHAPRPQASRPAWPGALAGRKDVHRFDTLLALGLQDEARDELLPSSRSIASGGRDAALATAWALIESGAYKEGQALARPYCTSPWKDGDPVAQQACWPRPAQQVVHAIAGRYGVPELVPYGIMTTESALDPGVTSLAGARGLMQLMPAEAGDLHRDLYGDRPYHPDLLYSAPYNASLGVAELGSKKTALGDVLDGPDIVAAIAAYNGGEAAVQRWADGLGGHPEFDRFAEQIGYTETRRYVRKVLGTVMAYRYVYGDPSP